MPTTHTCDGYCHRCDGAGVDEATGSSCPDCDATGRCLTVDVSPAPTADELYSTLRGLVLDPEFLQVIEDLELEDGCQPWSVWLPTSPDRVDDLDLIGAGSKRSEALADAIETVRGWEER